MILLLLFFLANINYSNCDVYFDDFDDDNNYQMVNVFLYDSKDNCLIDNRLSEYVKNFNLKCNCLKYLKCDTALFNNYDFINTSIDYNNITIYLSDISYNNSCYEYNNVYIKGILEIDEICVPRVIGFIVVCALFLSLLLVIVSIYYDKKIKKKMYNSI